MGGWQVALGAPKNSWWCSKLYLWLVIHTLTHVLNEIVAVGEVGRPSSSLISHINLTEVWCRSKMEAVAVMWPTGLPACSDNSSSSPSPPETGAERQRRDMGAVIYDGNMFDSVC
jgi:hypothetical protein